MGVQGLWELLAPVGRRVSVETLAGKRLAIDASIWMIQFMKAMRDEKGEMVRNAHLIGFFRRICKLLYLRTKPIFIFDGGTPSLKRRTIAARRRHRENARAKIRKTAEKLLINQLKRKRLEELAADIRNGKLKEEKGSQSVKDNSKGKQVAEECSTSGSCTQESLDELLAASLAFEEDGGFSIHESPSTRECVDAEEGDEEEDEEMILPVTSDRIDLTVLASLPPSMQLDLLVQMRERLMAENRQKYQMIKKAPTKFSELQIQSYLRTVAFRREIDEVQKSAAGRQLGGLQTSRIASESSREFIFSSSFTGDKQKLATMGVQKDGGDKASPITSTFSNLKPKTTPSPSNPVARASVNDTGKNFMSDVDTYCDERGRVRVSRVRGLGMCMTRDLQRNLDMMKENEGAETSARSVYLPNRDTAFLNLERFSSEKGQNPVLVGGNFHASSLPLEEKGLEISFAEDEVEKEDGDDYLFAHLVSCAADVPSEQRTSDSESDSIWEEGIVLENTEGTFPKHKESTLSETGATRAVTNGNLYEEADIQEATRRSLQDLEGRPSSNDALQVGSKLKSGSPPHSSANEPGCLDSNYERNVMSVSNISDNYHSSVVSSIADLSPKPSKIIEMDQSLLISCEKDTSQLLNDVETNSLENNLTLKASEQESTCKDRFVNNVSYDVDEAVGEIMAAEELYELDSDTKIVQLTDSDDIGPSNSNQVSTPSKCSRRNETTIECNGISNVGVNGAGHEHGSFEFTADDMIFMQSGLDKEISSLREEHGDLIEKHRKLEKNTESVSSEMFAECQELLQMFGLPYIIAPMEAEAQCAFMEMSKQVDGVVTDDSDVFLFGARSVYKNIFDDRKYVETYFMKDIENELGLSRSKLISMAMLLGSDYTEGISGIGIVNAIEVVQAFPEEDGLKCFREWIESPDPSILGQFKPIISDAKRKNASKTKTEGADEVALEDKSGLDNKSEIKRDFMSKHRTVSKNWHIPSSFPSEAVVSAYNSPQVDKSLEPFSWGKPDLILLRKLCWEKFGWNNQKADELLLPVLKEYDKHETQLRLEAFYSFNERFAKIRSRRIKKAVKGITGSFLKELDHSKSEIQGDHRSGKKSCKDRSNEGDISTKNKVNNGVEASTTLKEDGSGRWEAAEVKPRGRGRTRGSSRRKRSAQEPNVGYDENINASEETQILRRSKRRVKEVKYLEGSETDDALDVPSKPPAEPPEEDDLIQGTGEGAHQMVLNSKKQMDSSSETDAAAAWGGTLEGTGRPVSDDTVGDFYLLAGGGFCTEDEGGRHMIHELMERVNASSEMDEAAGRRGSESLEGHGTDEEKGPRLSAMPSLKRKRRP